MNMINWMNKTVKLRCTQVIKLVNSLCFKLKFGPHFTNFSFNIKQYWIKLVLHRDRYLRTNHTKVISSDSAVSGQHVTTTNWPWNSFFTQHSTNITLWRNNIHQRAAFVTSWLIDMYQEEKVHDFNSSVWWGNDVKFFSMTVFIIIQGVQIRSTHAYIRTVYN